MSILKHYQSEVVVRKKEDFLINGVISSSVQYRIDGIIDMGSTPIEVPAGGIYLIGHNFNISKLISSASNYTMFTSPVGGSGDVIKSELAIEVTGTNSKVYALTDTNGLHALEIESVNYNNCTSLGYLDSYRQHFEDGTGRFGGKPELEFRGNWIGGAKITNSIIRGIDDTWSGTLFKAGAGLVFNRRFYTDINVDLGTLCSFKDFAPANFANDDTLQIKGAFVTRDGVVDDTDPNILPNISHLDRQAFFKDNIGIQSTYEGGLQTLTVEAATVIGAANTYYDLNGTWTASGLQHFDSPANGQLRTLSDTKEYELGGSLEIRGTAGDVIDVKIVIYRAASATFEDSKHIRRVINNFTGSVDVAFFVLVDNVKLFADDYVKIQVENKTAARTVTCNQDSYWYLKER